MRTLNWKLANLVIICALAFCWTQNASAQWPHQTGGCNKWSFEIGGKAFDRPTGNFNAPLVTNSVTGQTLFSGSDALELDAGTGAEIRLNMKDAPSGVTWELRSLLGNWDNTTDVAGPNLASPLFPPNFSPDSFGWDYDSQFYSIELNAKRAVKPGVTWLYGPRYISFRENVDARTQTTVGGFDFLTSSAGEARNSMIGYQAGFELNFPLTELFYIQSSIRAGGFNNQTKFQRVESDSISGVTSNQSQTKSTGSFVGEVSTRIYYDVIPGSCSTYVGYDAMWIDGIALAPPQYLTFGGTGAVDTANTPFIQSINFGVRYRY